MAKKTRTGKIKAPFFEYSWYRELNKPETNKKFIQDQIDSFVLLIENEDKICSSNFYAELKEFIALIPAQGHLKNLDKEYQDK